MATTAGPTSPSEQAAAMGSEQSPPAELTSSSKPLSESEYVSAPLSIVVVVSALRRSAAESAGSSGRRSGRSVSICSRASTPIGLNSEAWNRDPRRIRSQRVHRDQIHYACTADFLSPKGCPMADLHVGLRVRLVGLVARPEYNGRLGTVVSFNAESERYSVRLDDGPVELALKRSSLEATGCILCRKSDPAPLDAGCSCRGALLHVDCRVKAAAQSSCPSSAEAWTTCPTCGYSYAGKLELELASARFRSVAAMPDEVRRHRFSHRRVADQPSPCFRSGLEEDVRGQRPWCCLERTRRACRGSGNSSQAIRDEATSTWRRRPLHIE